MFKQSTIDQQEQVRFIEYWLELPYSNNLNNYDQCQEFIDNYLDEAQLSSDEYRSYLEDGEEE